MLDINFSFAYRILTYAKDIGIDSEILLDNAGVDASDLSRFDNKIAADKYFNIFDESIRLAKDPCFGLHMGEYFEWQDLSNLGYIVNLGHIITSCRDLGEAMGKVGEYLNFIGSPFDLNIIERGGETDVVFKPKSSGKVNVKHCIDEALSGFIKIVRSITSKFIRLKAVNISYDAPDDTSEYKRIFLCPVLFGRSKPALVFRSRDLVEPITAENSVLPIPVHSSKCLFENITGTNEYSRKINLLLAKQLQKGSPCIKRAAKELGMSVRCLQMKLSKEGETFSRIVKRVRKELAKTYLMEKDYSIDEITYLLGFSDPSVFHRAFKTWTGVTPGKYRDAL